MNIIKKKFAYLFAMGVFVLGISSSIPVFAASSSNSIIHQREYMTLNGWRKFKRSRGCFSICKNSWKTQKWNSY